MKADNLNSNFVNELIKLSFKNKRVFEVVSRHIRYQFFPNETYKVIWKSASELFNVSGKLPTIGSLSQKFNYRDDVISTLNSIKEADIIDQKTAVDQFEIFLKNAMFIDYYEEFGDLFTKGKSEEAFEKLNDLSESLNSFTIKDRYYNKIYSDIIDRYSDKVNNLVENSEPSVKIPTGIDEFDDISRGGVDKGDTFLFLAGSGVGKSKGLKSISQHASMRGFKILHVQGEGSRQECLDAYDAASMGCNLHDIEYANVDSKKLDKMKKSANQIMANGGEIYVEAFEQFDTASLADVRELVKDIIKTYGELDALVLDYLECFDPGNGKRYKVSEERQRREALSSELKNIAVEFNIAIFTATQATTPAPALVNDPAFILTRSHISEVKALVKPFSYFITMNQTADEKENKKMRLYVDKCRKYKGGQIIQIFTDYDKERFYDKKRTLNNLYEKK